MTDVQVVREGDPRCAALEAAGYVLVATSWGAHLELPDQPDLRELQPRIDSALAAGYTVSQLGPEWADALFALEVLTNADYPSTPATHQSMPTREGIRNLWRENAWVFGAARHGELVGAGATSDRGDRIEIDFGSVHPEHRRTGVASAIAAHALLALTGMGFRRFATGGAGVNVASRATVQALGFRIDEVWRSYRLDS